VPAHSFSQSLPEQLSSQTVNEYFDHLYQADTRLISGEFYQHPVGHQATGHPYFIDTDWKVGSLVINNVKFDSLPLKYDISSNMLVMNTINFTDSYLQLSVKKENIEFFTLNDRLFLPFDAPLGVKGPVFYEQITHGSISLFVSKTKELKLTPGRLTDYSYILSTKRLLQINDKLIKYRGRSTLYKQFPDLKDQLRLYLRNHKLRFKKLKLQDHAVLINYCNNLLEQQ